MNRDELNEAKAALLTAQARYRARLSEAALGRCDPGALADAARAYREAVLASVVAHAKTRSQPGDRATPERRSRPPAVKVVIPDAFIRAFSDGAPLDPSHLAFGRCLVATGRLTDAR